MKNRIGLVFGLGLILIVAACSNPNTPTAAPPTQGAQSGQVQRGLAVVDKVEVTTSGGQTTVIARGELPDGCTSIADSKVEQSNGVFVVTLNTTRPADAVCTLQVTPFEQKVALDTTGLAAGEYVVVVNGVSGKVTVSGSGAAQQPTATQAAPQPTTTQSQPTPTQAQATPTATPASSAGASGECTNVAAFFEDITVPDGTAFKQGAKFTKTWRVRNEGTCTWQGYGLVFIGGEQMSAPPVTFIPTTVPPREIVDVSVELVAPMRGGPYTGNWQFQDAAGNNFGVGKGKLGTLYAVIAVNYSGDEISVGAPQPPGSGDVLAPNSCGAQGNGGYENQVMTLFNNARSAAGLAPLNAQGQLVNAAQKQSVDMACNEFIGHAGTDGSSPKSRVQSQNYANWNSAVENVYGWSDATPQTAFDWWWNSHIHHAAIMKPDHALVGISYAVRNGVGYFTAVFARP
ncbi:MAG: NBR1-Ig-like domain-containing protein [Anaerolineales bacterium]